MTAPIDFWFSIGSPYTFLAVMRLTEVAERTDVEVRWRPFDARAIQLDANDVPFADKPLKAAYMWRDIERRAAMYRVVPKLPAPYPLAELERANRVALIAAREGQASFCLKEFAVGVECIQQCRDAAGVT